jgi:hypothetical protein
MANLIEAIQVECNRVRELLPYYEELGPVGAFGAAALKAAVKAGETSIASGDIVQMVRALDSLRACE